MLKSKNLIVNNKNGVCFLTFPKLIKCNTVNHAFSTKIGGVSKGYFGPMNLNLNGKDNIEDVKENYKRLCLAASINPEHLVISHQTHTDNLLIVGKKDVGKGIYKERDYSDVDGLITNESGVALVTQYADCVPLLFCDPVKKVIAASHAGWRGTVKEIGIKTVKTMQKEFGCSPSDIIAAIGPSICQECYEVDMPVYNEFKNLKSIDLDKVFKKADNGHFKLNLWEANKEMLLYAGIKNENIDITDLCTCCNPQYLHSHRYTNGRRGTIGAVIELK